ncbi:hypothetical protein CPC08DRAFT_410805 [Agrocybe pediades]|nr:hypothetical protein CPC08DRAFT_410805 [Agrocybe pediades]
MTDKNKPGRIRAKIRNLIFDAFTKTPSTGKRIDNSEKTLPTPSILDIRSPVCTLLANNIQPTDEEISLTHAFIERAKEEEALLQNGEASNPQHSQHLERVVHLIKQHQAIVSPIRRLPVELLQDIFMHIRAPMPHDHDIYTGLIREPLHLSFSQISQYWRAAALSCASLWRTVPHINLDDVATRGADYVEMLDLFLKRTKNGPIDVHISSQAFDDAHISHPVLDLVVAHSSRWAKARLNLSFAAFKNLHAASENHLALLETLIIQVVHNRGTVAVSQVGGTVDFFVKAPKLRRVSITGTFSGSFGLPSSGLVEYQEQSCHPEHTPRPLQSYATLTRLSIRDFVADTGNWKTMVFTNLVHLRIHIHDASFCRPFLDSITLPCIEELEITAVGIGVFLLPFLLPVFERSATPSKLKKLYLRTWAQQPLELTSLLRLTPLLTHLNVQIPCVEDIQLLTARTFPLVPLLQVCEFEALFDGRLLTNEEINLLRLFAESRCDYAPVDGPDSDSARRTLTVLTVGRWTGTP